MAECARERDQKCVSMCADLMSHLNWNEGRLTVGAHEVVDNSRNTEEGNNASEGLGTLTGGSDGLARTVRTEGNKVSCRDSAMQ